MYHAFNLYYKSLKDKGHERLFKKIFVRHINIYSKTFFLHLRLKPRTNFFPTQHFDLYALKEVTLPCTRILRALVFHQTFFLNP